MEGNTRRGSPAGFSSLFPGASLGRLDSLHEPMGRSSAFWGTPWCSFGAIGGGLPQRASDTPPERRECSSHGRAALFSVSAGLLVFVRSGWLRWHSFGRHTERGRFASQRSEMRSIHLRVEDDPYHKEG